MGIEVTSVGEGDREEWNRAVERSSQTTPLHRYEALRAIARESDTELHALLGYKGQEPVGVFPAFERHRGPLTLLYSPPEGIGVYNLGPALVDQQQPKQRKAEKRNRRFVRSCLDRLKRTVDPDRVKLKTETGYPDVRPFIWNGFDAEFDYTYVLDLTPGPDALLEAFSSEARRKIRNTDPDRYEIEEGDAADVRRIVEHLRRRYDGREEEYGGASARLATDLYEALPDGQVRPYVCYVDGEYEGGNVVLESDDAAYCWQGGAKPAVDLPVNDLLEWHQMRAAFERGKSRYDLVGGMNPRLNEYKSKFSPDLAQAFVLSFETKRMTVAAEVHGRVTDRLDSLNRESVPLGTRAAAYLFD